ncbi:MAG: hypothetical protein JWM35_649, partial [Verrucomicrobia bacterium]|nr:hypothetical protein [Verrucomicrobiota bacterium]
MRRSSENFSGGFALMLTLVLMAFAVALIIAFAALARIEGAGSDHSILQAQARRNARLAFTIALGQLQKNAGPDVRVTATSESFTTQSGAVHYTGVWESPGNADAPLTWLVSGSEGGRTSLPAGSEPSVELLGMATSGVVGDVLAPMQDITVGAKTVGRYAWWVGDEAVKASVALADRTAEVAYAPYDSNELRARLRQQRALGAGPVDPAGVALFEPRSAKNTDEFDDWVQFNQLAQLRAADGSRPMDQTTLRSYFHAWTTNSSAVLSNSKLGGLRRDLSLKPTLLGAAYAAWADYANYMESPLAPLSPAIAPSYPSGMTAESLRRRFRMTTPQSTSGVTHGVAPILSYFVLTFNIRTDQSVSGSLRPLEVRARWLATFWNPYASALVPENLQLEVSGLPSVTVVNDTAGTTLSPMNLDTLYGAPLRISLPWVLAGRDDQQSWLPGRVYTWSAAEDLNKAAAVPPGGFGSIFYTRTMSTTAGQGVQRAAPFLSITNSAQAHLQSPAAQLTLRLYRVLADGSRELIGTSLSPLFSAFSTTPAAINASTYQFSYVSRLAESIDTPATPDAWLASTGQDVRESEISAACYLPGPNGPRPELYPNYTSVSFPDRLLDRALPASAGSATGQSYNEDVPLFDLPRAPLLSIGALQNLHTLGTRPFAVGNSWGNTGGWNALFDQYFFSGLGAPVDATLIPEAAPLPNPLLAIVTRTEGGAKIRASDLVAEAAAELSAKFLRQSGAFNINSVNPLAWAAVLRSGRFRSEE